MVKLLLAYDFRQMFFIGENAKYVHVTNSFNESLIFFSLTIVGIFCLKFDFSLHQRNTVDKYILQKETNDGIKAERYTFSSGSDIVDVKEYCFFQAKLIISLSTVFNLCPFYEHLFFETEE